MRVTDLVSPLRNNAGRLHAVELLDHRAYVGLSGNSQADGAPIVDGCTSSVTEFDDDTGALMRDTTYHGVMIRLSPTRGRGLVIATSRPRPKWLALGRITPMWLTAHRGHGRWWPGKVASTWARPPRRRASFDPTPGCTAEVTSLDERRAS